MTSSVCLSNAVRCGFRVGVQGQKPYQRVPSRQVPICPFRHFCRLATERTGKSKSKKTRTWVILRHRKPRMHWFSAHYLLLRTWDDRHRELCSSRFGGLSLGAFIKSKRLNWLCGYSRNRFVQVIPYFVRSTIGYHSNSWASCCALGHMYNYKLLTFNSEIRPWNTEK